MVGCLIEGLEGLIMGLIAGLERLIKGLEGLI
jgi:hypothetical protein